MAKLTTTSYAILGLLERRTWSAYELTKYMQHSGIRGVWPRTESRIYVEFKNLVAHGLATASEQTKQGRKRSVYKISAAGRKGLRNWLLSPEGSFRLESEPLLKLLFGDLDDGATHVQLEHMHAQLISETELMLEEVNRSLENGFYFEENALHNSQLLSLLTDLLESRSDWLNDMRQSGRRKTPKSTSNEAAKIYRQQAKRLASLLEKLQDQ